MLAGALGGAIRTTLGGPWTELGVGVLADWSSPRSSRRCNRCRSEPDHCGHRDHPHCVGVTSTLRWFYGTGAGLCTHFHQWRFPACLDCRSSDRLLPADPTIWPTPRCHDRVTYSAPAGLAIRATGENLPPGFGMGHRHSRSGGPLRRGARRLRERRCGACAQVAMITAGRGFIAIAIVVLGRWHPIGAGSRPSSSGLPRRCSSRCRRLDSTCRTSFSDAALCGRPGRPRGGRGRVRAPGRWAGMSSED
jgi:hypothetical protein